MQSDSIRCKHSQLMPRHNHFLLKEIMKSKCDMQLMQKKTAIIYGACIAVSLLGMHNAELLSNQLSQFACIRLFLPAVHGVQSSSTCATANEQNLPQYELPPY
jgi:hypothetical protein